MNEKAVDLALKVAEVTRERDDANAELLRIRIELSRIIGIAETAHVLGVTIPPEQILNRKDYEVRA